MPASARDLPALRPSGLEGSGRAGADVPLPSVHLIPQGPEPFSLGDGEVGLFRGIAAELEEFHSPRRLVVAGTPAWLP